MKIFVTGAFGYSGRYIAQRLVDAGHGVSTLTNSRRPNPFGDKIRVSPFNFDDPARLQESLCGADVLINTYWVRFDYGTFSHAEAVRNTRVLFQAAKHAGIRRIVHVSITNPDIHAELPYFHGKAELEAHLENLGVSYCILRPAVLFGREDILINNIAWSLRYLPVFGVFGSGEYKLQPIYIDDFAELAVEKAVGATNEVINAIGPETFSYRELAQVIRDALGLKRPIISVPAEVGYWAGRWLGLMLGDVVITREEIRGLMEGRLYVDAPPVGRTRMSEWVIENRETLGRNYASELARR